MNSLAQKVLRLLHPEAEKTRMDFRYAMARALAETEDLERTITGCLEKPPKKPNGSGTDR